MLGRGTDRNTVNEDDKFHDSDYSFNGETNEENGEDSARVRLQVEMEGKDTRMSNDDEVESDYARSEELQSCSSTDEECLLPVRPKYAEFNEEVDMKNPHFKIGMKFRSFKQFKEAVKNYGIKNCYVMNFNPNNKRKCKTYCRKDCPFYLWASPMISDKNKVHIKTSIL